MTPPKTLDYYFSRTIKQGDCLIWQGAKVNSGYGKAWRNGRLELIHRIIYTIFYGEIKDLQVVRHKCDVKLCINPDHLLIGYPQDNVYDQIERGTIRPPHGKCKPIGWYR